MKLKGSKGTISRTLMFQAAMGVVDTVLASVQVLDHILTPTHFALVFLALSIAQKLGNMYLRTITTGPLN